MHVNREDALNDENQCTSPRQQLPKNQFKCLVIEQMTIITFLSSPTTNQTIVNGTMVYQNGQLNNNHLNKYAIEQLL